MVPGCYVVVPIAPVRAVGGKERRAVPRTLRLDSVAALSAISYKLRHRGSGQAGETPIKSAGRSSVASLATRAAGSEPAMPENELVPFRVRRLGRVFRSSSQRRIPLALAMRLLSRTPPRAQPPVGARSAGRRAPNPLHFRQSLAERLHRARFGAMFRPPAVRR